MPEKIWIFDTVSLSNFLLSESMFTLNKRYRRCGVISGKVYDEVSAGFADYPMLKQVDKLIDDNVFGLVPVFSMAGPSAGVPAVNSSISA